MMAFFFKVAALGLARRVKRHTEPAAAATLNTLVPHGLIFLCHLVFDDFAGDRVLMPAFFAQGA